MARDVSAPADDTIREPDVRPAAMDFAHLKFCGTLAYIEAPAIALRREENAVVALDQFGKVRIELHDRTPPLELSHAKVFEPMLRTLHAVQHTLRAVGKRHHRVLRGGRERAVD